MPGTLLGNQARYGYGGDDERLRSAVSLSASLVYLSASLVYLSILYLPIYHATVDHTLNFAVDDSLSFFNLLTPCNQQPKYIGTY